MSLTCQDAPQGQALCPPRSPLRCRDLTWCLHTACLTDTSVFSEWMNEWMNECLQLRPPLCLLTTSCGPRCPVCWLSSLSWAGGSAFKSCIVLTGSLSELLLDTRHSSFHFFLFSWTLRPREARAACTPCAEHWAWPQWMSTRVAGWVRERRKGIQMDGKERWGKAGRQVRQKNDQWRSDG